MKLALHFARYGPYHHARLASACEALTPHGWEVIGLQSANHDTTYRWQDPPTHDLITLIPNRPYEAIGATELQRAMTATLDRLRPDAVAIAGWGFPDARAALAWCRSHRARAILMSETRAADGTRRWWKEWAKSRLVRRFDAALVGGPSHRAYLISLGFPPHRIATGYDVIDNAYFTQTAGVARSQPSTSANNPSPYPYFLASTRFIPRKNLPFLIQAYHLFLASAPWPAWNLCLLGDGPQKPHLLSLCRQFGLTAVEAEPWQTHAPDHPTVFFPGFRPYPELPRFHAQAGCFIHPALEEPWGLVLNEAAACSLPILASVSTGAAETLVENGTNGWTFDPRDAQALARLMQRIASPDCPRSQLGAASLRLLEERAPTRAFGIGLRGCLENFPTKPVEQFWQTQAQDYTANYADLPRGVNFNFRTRLALAQRLTQGLSGHLLDCATGSGEITCAILQAGTFQTATLADISAPMLDLARHRIEALQPRPYIRWVNQDIFAYLESSPHEPRFDLILCLGLIAHTGRLDKLLRLWKARLRPSGHILLQSSLLDHPGTRFLRAVSYRRHLRRKGYPIHYYHHAEIEQQINQSGLSIITSKRYCLGIPYGDRIHPRLNHWLEKRGRGWASRWGADALYLIGHAS